ncbi:MAG: hypothetical protein MJ232_08815, partial [archaeon]|nr:hypothetical protein [archaeon]
PQTPNPKPQTPNPKPHINLFFFIFCKEILNFKKISYLIISQKQNEKDRLYIFIYHIDKCIG